MTPNNFAEPEKNGRFVMSYSNEVGGSLTLVSAAAGQTSATELFKVCVSTLGDTVRVVSSSSSDDTKQTLSTGGDNMERRIAVLETQVAHIQSDVSEIKSDQKIVISGISELRSDVKLLIQQYTDISNKLTDKASKDNVDSKANELKAWILGILLLSIAMPIILFLLNLYLKKS